MMSSPALIRLDDEPQSSHAHKLTISHALERRVDP
jgi:hypothetical protein